MIKYKINYIYAKDKDNNINDIFIKIIKKEVKEFIKNTLNKSKIELTLNRTYLPMKDKEARN